MKLSLRRIDDCQFVVNTLNCSSKEAMLGYSILVSIWNFRRFVHGIANSITKAQDTVAFIEPMLLNFTNSDFTTAVCTSTALGKKKESLIIGL